MGQGYVILIVILGPLVDYGIAQTLQANDSTTIRKELLLFLPPSLSLNLFICTYYGHYYHTEGLRFHHHRRRYGRDTIEVAQEPHSFEEGLRLEEGRLHMASRPPIDERSVEDARLPDRGRHRLDPDLRRHLVKGRAAKLSYLPL